MNKYLLSIALVAIPVTTVFCQNQSVLPGGCVRTHIDKSLCLSSHEITVAVGEEFTIADDFGIGSLKARCWKIINLPQEIALVSEFLLKRNPPITMCCFRALEEGAYILSFENAYTHDVITVHVQVTMAQR